MMGRPFLIDRTNSSEASVNGFAKLFASMWGTGLPKPLGRPVCVETGER